MFCAIRQCDWLCFALLILALLTYSADLFLKTVGVFVFNVFYCKYWSETYEKHSMEICHGSAMVYRACPLQTMLYNCAVVAQLALTPTCPLTSSGRPAWNTLWSKSWTTQSKVCETTKNNDKNSKSKSKINNSKDFLLRSLLWKIDTSEPQSKWQKLNLNTVKCATTKINNSKRLSSTLLVMKAR